MRCRNCRKRTIRILAIQTLYQIIVCNILFFFLLQNFHLTLSLFHLTPSLFHLTLSLFFLTLSLFFPATAFFRLFGKPLLSLPFDFKAFFLFGSPDFT